MNVNKILNDLLADILMTAIQVPRINFMYIDTKLINTEALRSLFFITKQATVYREVKKVGQKTEVVTEKKIVYTVGFCDTVHTKVLSFNI